MPKLDKVLDSLEATDQPIGEYARGQRFILCTPIHTTEKHDHENWAIVSIVTGGVAHFGGWWRVRWTHDRAGRYLADVHTGKYRWQSYCEKALNHPKGAEAWVDDFGHQLSIGDPNGPLMMGYGAPIFSAEDIA